MSLVEAGCWAGVLAGTIAALFLVVRNGLVLVQQPLSFGLVFLGWYVLFYVVATLAGCLAGWLMARLLRLAGRVVGLALAAAILVQLAWAISGGWPAVILLFALDGPGRFRWLCPVAFVLARLGLLATALRAAGRAAPARPLALLAVLTGVGALLPVRQAPADRPRPAASRSTGQRFLLVGVDGASWQLLDPLIARGELPWFAALKQR